MTVAIVHTEVLPEFTVYVYNADYSPFDLDDEDRRYVVEHVDNVCSAKENEFRVKLYGVDGLREALRDIETEIHVALIGARREQYRAAIAIKKEVLAGRPNAESHGGIAVRKYDEYLEMLEKDVEKAKDRLLAGGE